MADAAVQSAIPLLQLLAQLIAKEANLLAGLKDDISTITSELKVISAFLKDADQRAEEDDNVKLWVNGVRLLTFNIEDVIEDYQFLQKSRTFFRRFIDVLSRRKPNIAIAIKRLCKEAGTVRHDCFTYGFRKINLEQRDAQVANFPVIGEHELVGAQIPKGEIIKLLSLEDMNLRRETIAVLGMRGLGKTTLVGIVYNDQSVRDYFPIRALISASYTCNPGRIDMLRSMMKQFYEAESMANFGQASTSSSPQNNNLGVNNVPDINSMEEISLLKQIGQYLKEKRYMVVFDDVGEDTELATYVKSVLPENNLGSKILMTTRYENMANLWLEGCWRGGVYKLRPQTLDNARTFFFKKIFPNNGGNCPPLLRDLGEGFVERCDGLPLAIGAITHLLSVKPKEVFEWKNVHANLGCYLRKNSHISGIHNIVYRDYHDLKHYLQPCFLYFFLFPKRHAINRMKLIRLWIAEGFIRESTHLTPEEVADEYLNDLVNMCLILVENTDCIGKPKSLRVHDFFHEIMPYKLEELSFCKIISKHHSTHVDNPRRLSIHNDHDDLLKCITRSNISKIRSLFLIEQRPEIYPEFLKRDFFKTVYLLKVLDLSNAPIDAIPEALGEELLNLRYLSLKNTRVGRIPCSIRNLQDLQTLDLKQTNIHELPAEICCLHKLRHLLAGFYSYNPAFSYHCLKGGGILMPRGANWDFKELQKLEIVDVGGIAEFTKVLASLTKLRKLKITNLRENVDHQDLCVAVQRMIHLETLGVLTVYKYETITFLDDIVSPPALKRLYVGGRLRSFSGCFLQLHSLLKLHLCWSHLEHDPLQFLQELPNLVVLKLLEAYDGTSMIINNVGFQKLKILCLLDLHNLKSLSISEGALPLLKELSIGESRALSMPTGIQYLLMLKTLQFIGTTEAFRMDTKPGRRYESIVKHVPNVDFYEKREGWYKKIDRM